MSINGILQPSHIALYIQLYAHVYGRVYMKFAYYFCTISYTIL